MCKRKKIVDMESETLKSTMFLVALCVCRAQKSLSEAITCGANSAALRLAGCSGIYNARVMEFDLNNTGVVNYRGACCDIRASTLFWRRAISKVTIFMFLNVTCYKITFLIFDTYWFGGKKTSVRAAHCLGQKTLAFVFFLKLLLGFQQKGRHESIQNRTSDKSHREGTKLDPPEPWRRPVGVWNSIYMWRKRWVIQWNVHRNGLHKWSFATASFTGAGMMPSF